MLEDRRDIVGPMSAWRPLLACLVLLLVPAAVRAAPQDAVARVTGCGPPAMAALVTSWSDARLLAITTHDAVTRPDGEVCGSPVLVLPEGRGRLLARVGARRAHDDLAVLEILPDQDIPVDLETLVVADRTSFDQALQGHRAVLALTDIDDAGHVHSRLARLDTSDRTAFTIDWMHSAMTWPWLPGAPVVGDDGALLGIMGAPEGQAAPARGTGGSIHAFLNLHYELRRPSPNRRYGIWLAHLPGDEQLDDYWRLVGAIRRELLRAGLDPQLWEIRDLGLPIDAPQQEVERLARQLGGSVNASLVVATTWDQGPDRVRRHRAMLVQLAREPSIGERPPDADPTGHGRRQELLVLPTEAADSPRMVAQAVVAMAASDIVRLHPQTQPRPERSLERARDRLLRLRREHERWRAGMSRASATASLWAREGSATIDRLDADLIRALLVVGGDLDAEGGGYGAVDRAYLRALEALPHDKRPCAWMELQSLRLEAWLELPEHRRPQPRLDPLLEAASEALERVAPEACPVERAQLQRHRGQLLTLRISDDPEADLRQAIDAYEDALSVYSLVADPRRWALTQLDLGLAWQGLPNPDQAGVLEAAIGAHRRALSMLDPEVYPLAWALGQLRLGDALADNPVGDPFDNRRQALAAYERALTVFDSEGEPVQWARTRNGMGIALQGLPWQDPPEHLELALAAHQDALTVFTREEHPADWALTHAWLGNAVRQLPGDRAEARFQGALLGLQRSLEVFEELDRPRDQAATWTKLGDAWRASPLGDRGENLAKAIDAYERALSVYSREGDPEHWAQTWQRLGQAYREQRSGDRGEHLTRSVEAFQFALEVHSADGNPIAWELTQGDLFAAQAWQYALEAQTEAPGSVEALHAHGEAALQEALLRQARRLPWSGQDPFLEASDHFQRAHERAPDRPEILDGLTLALWYQGRYAEAAQAQARLVTLRPQDAWAQRSLRLFRLRAQIAAHEDDVEAWAKLGDHYDEDGDLAGAIEAWSRVLTLAPSDARALERVVELAIRTDQREKATQAVALGLVHAPEDPRVLAMAVRVELMVRGDPARALSLSNRRLTPAPAAIPARLDHALILLLNNELTHAGVLLEELSGEPSLDGTQRLELELLRMAAGAPVEDVAPTLLEAYRDLAPGATLTLPWPALTTYVTTTRGADEADALLAVFHILTQPRGPEPLERLELLLGPR
jgi:tetratricopeptide (TPR) repeat protein